MGPLQELVTFARQSGTAGTSYTLRELSSNDKKTLHRILFRRIGLQPILGTERRNDLQPIFGTERRIDLQPILRNKQRIDLQPILRNERRIDIQPILRNERRIDLQPILRNEDLQPILGTERRIDFDFKLWVARLENIVAENSIDPELLDFVSRTALHYVPERGELGMAELLVERIGADWDLGMKSALSISNETLASRHPECVEFLQKCREMYSIKPNSEGGVSTQPLCLDSDPPDVVDARRITSLFPGEFKQEYNTFDSHSLPVLPMSVYNEITHLCHGRSFLRLHPRVTLRPGLNWCRR
ncbi:hypothetical protein O3P69_018740 [Scylla paramamosain]|uniref:Uncharacterized protein n=1 Tax=Scylla paramamosain TaxID=85552 RepID=A0AAW0SSC6_SCYPA